MKILSVDTSANVATVAICEDDRLICEQMTNTKKTHSQTLMPMIDNVLAQAEMEISDVDLIAVANGPGSFTGLRIGVSTVKGIAEALNIPVVGVSTLEGMAYNLAYSSHLICPIMDARREQVYNAVYEWENEELRELKEPRALGLSELLDELLHCDKKAVFLGDGVPVHKEKIVDVLGDRAVFAPSCASLQRASALCDIAKIRYSEGKAVKGLELETVYLRKPQAEREAEERKKENKK